jgi:ABC-2 type transport system permease protein
MKAEIRNAVATLTSANRSDRWRGVLFLGLLVAFVVADEFLAYRLFRAFLSVGGASFEFVALILALRMLSLLFLVVLAMLFFGGMIAAIDTFYFDDDIDFLASHPIPRPALLLRKLVSVWSTSAWVVFLVVVPVMTAYSRALGLGFAHLPLSTFSLFLFTIPPIALSSTVVMGLMRFLPIDRAKESILAFGVVLSFGMISLYRLLSPAKLFQFRPEQLINDAAGFVREFTLPFSTALPSNVMGQALVAAAPLKYGAWAGHTGALAILAVISVGVFLGVGGLIFETDRPISGNAARPGPLERVFGLGRASAFLARRCPEGWRGVVYKELVSNVRDPMQISHLVLMIGIVALHFANLSEIPYSIHPAARVLVAFLNLGLVGFLSAAVAVRFIYPSLSLEGRPFWLIETAPISAKAWIAVKFAVGWLPLALVSLVIVLASNYLIGIGAGLTALWTVATLSIATVIAALGTAVGIRMPVFGKRNVFEISSSSGGIIFLLMALLYVGGTIALLVAPTYDAALGGRMPVRGALLAAGTILAASAFLTVAAYRASVSGMERLAESRYGSD